jgi:hypothetical protein
MCGNPKGGLGSKDATIGSSGQTASSKPPALFWAQLKHRRIENESVCPVSMAALAIDLARSRSTQAEVLNVRRQGDRAATRIAVGVHRL